MARGKTDFCAAHGGGVRCKAKGCYKIAIGATSLCRMHSTAQAAAQSSALGPEHANLGSEALKLAVQHIGGGEISDDDDGEGEGEAGGHKDGKVGKEDNDDSSLDEQAVLFGGAGRK